MSLKLFLHDDVAGSCELAELRPYPAVTSTDSTLDVTAVVGPDGKTTYDVSGLEQDVASGIFGSTSNRTSWWAGWTAVKTANFGTETAVDWVNVGPGVTSPDHVTDVTTVSHLGSAYFYVRRMLTYIWVDTRILINGAAVITWTNDVYHYTDGRTYPAANGDYDGISNLRPLGTVNLDRANVPAGATVQVQARVRWRGVGAQATLAYARFIGGLRSRTSYIFTPRTVVIGEE